MDRSDTRNERNAEEIPLHYDPMDYSIDTNKQNEEENPLQAATSDPTVPDGFDCVNPPAELLFQILFAEPATLWLLWKVSGKSRYIPSETVFSGIICDVNRAYNKTNKVKLDYYVAVDEDGVQAVEWVH